MVVMQELRLSVRDAFDWIGRYDDSVATGFLALYKDLPVFPRAWGTGSGRISAGVSRLPPRASP